MNFISHCHLHSMALKPRINATSVMFRLIVFFGLYFGLARNSNLSRFVRFNAYQAILIDILLM